jgi:hypothetical protein
MKLDTDGYYYTIQDNGYVNAGWKPGFVNQLIAAIESDDSIPQWSKDEVLKEIREFNDSENV